ncbi:MAG: hypothetical protein KC983_10545, partial [Phycisphaerales bacterium]|nr:hypothetical protein [Phycisphaerales bacterium]
MSYRHKGFSILTSGSSRRGGRRWIGTEGGECGAFGEGSLSLAELPDEAGGGSWHAAVGEAEAEVDQSTGIDLVGGTGGTDGETVNRSDASVSVVFDGGNGGDTLAGGSGLDILKGSAGNDVIAGGGGNDLLIGGADDDMLAG